MVAADHPGGALTILHADHGIGLAVDAIHGCGDGQRSLLQFVSAGQLVQIGFAEAGHGHRFRRTDLQVGVQGGIVGER